MAIGFLALLYSAATGVAGDFCSSCGRDLWVKCDKHACKVCRGKCKEVTQYQQVWEVVCEPVCIPGLGCDCGKVRTVRRLVLKQVPVKTMEKQWSVQDHPCRVAGHPTSAADMAPAAPFAPADLRAPAPVDSSTTFAPRPEAQAVVPASASRVESAPAVEAAPRRSLGGHFQWALPK